VPAPPPAAPPPPRFPKNPGARFMVSRYFFGGRGGGRGAVGGCGIDWPRDLKMVEKKKRKNHVCELNLEAVYSNLVAIYNLVAI
jgi:hypothetical protein